MKKRKHSHTSTISQLGRLWLLFSLFLLSSDPGIYAQKEESARRGAQPGAAYTISDIESINHTNGNVMLNIPLAALPPGRGGLNYGISLNYNSKMFDTLTEPFYITPNGSEQSATLLQKSADGGWRYGYKYIFEQKTRPGVNPGTSPPPDEACFGPSDPDHRYFDVYKFVLTLPDGSSHEFKPSKFYTTVSTISQDGYYPVDINGNHRSARNIYDSEGVWYGCELIIYQTPGVMSFHTTDGSNLRLAVTTDADADPTNNYWLLRLPDGSRITENEPLPGGGTAGQRIYDRNGNFVEITETIDRFGQMQSVRAADQSGRGITITAGASGDEDTIRMAGFAGETLVRKVRWKLIGVRRDYKPDTEESKDEFEPFPLTASFRVVDRIILPVQLGSPTYQFSYNGNPEGNVSAYSDGFGEVSRVRLPTGATVDYQYELDGAGATVFSWQTVKHNPVKTKILSYPTRYDGAAETVTEKWLYAIGRAQSVITSPAGGVSTAVYSDIYDGGNGKVSSTATDTILTVRQFAQIGPPSVGGSPFEHLPKLQYTSIRDAAGNYRLTAFKEFSYDQNGNLLETRDYDWVEYDPAYSGLNAVRPADAVLKRVTRNEYYYPVPEYGTGQPPNGNGYFEVNSPDLLGLLKATEIFDGNLNPVARTEYIYDDAPAGPTNGNLTEKRVWDSARQPILGSPDADGFKLSAANAVTVRTAYDSYGNAVLKTDANGVRTRITYGCIGGQSVCPATEKNLYPTQTEVAADTPVERTWTARYDLFTGLTTETMDADNGGGLKTVTEYDALGRPTNVRTAAGTPLEAWNRTEYDDSPLRRITVRSDLAATGDGGGVTVQHFDGLGRVRLSRTLEDPVSEDPAVETDGVKVQTRYRFGNGPDPAASDGTYTLISNPYRSPTAAAAGDEPTMGWTLSHTTSTGGKSRTETFAGAALPPPWGGNVAPTGAVSTENDADRTLVTDQTGKQRISRTDALGNLTDVWEIVPTADGATVAVSFPTDPGIRYGYHTGYGYDTLGNLITVSQGVQTRNFAYSSLSRLLSAAGPETGATGYSYDANGNLTGRTDARGVTAVFSYDALNRLSTRSYTGEKGYATPATNYTYDDRPNARGLLTSVSNGVSITEYLEFDLYGRVLKSRQTTDGIAYEPLEYAYDLAGALTEQKYPSGRTVSYEYAAGGVGFRRIHGRDGGQTPKSYATSFAYAAHGEIERLRLGNGRWETTRYNSRLQPVRLGLGHSAADTGLWQAVYDYGAGANNGTIRSQTITVPAAGAVPGFTAVQTYSYDSFNRLRSAEETSEGSQTWKQVFTYDRYGNRRFEETATTTLPKNCAAAGAPAVCPADGRILNPTVSAATNRFDEDQFADGQIDYGFDPAGNLTLDARQRRFTYDGENRQVKVESVDQNGQPTGTIGEYFYDGHGNRVKKYVPATGETTVFVYDVSGRLAAEYTTLSEEQPPATRYLTRDYLGTPRLITDQFGRVAARHDFSPFGEEIRTPSRDTALHYGTAGIRRKFTSYERDTEAGLDYARARYYDPAHGRFTGPDTYLPSGVAKIPQSWNRYAYVMNKPLLYIDPTGEIWKKVGEGKWIWVDQCSRGDTCQEVVAGASRNGNLVILGSRGKEDITFFYANENGMIDMREVARHHNAQFVFEPASGYPCNRANGCEPYLNARTGAALFNVGHLYYAQSVTILGRDEKLSMSSGSFADGTTDRASPRSHSRGNNIDLRYMGPDGRVIRGSRASADADIGRTKTILRLFREQNVGLDSMITGHPARFSLPNLSRNLKNVHRNHLHMQRTYPAAPRRPGRTRRRR